MATRGRPKGAASWKVGEVAPVYGGIEGVLSRLEPMIAVLGNNRVAHLLGVSPSQPSRWRSGKDRPNPDVQTRILRLDSVMVRLFGMMTPRAALMWLESHDPHLGTRPQDALVLGRYEQVHGSLGIEEAGGGW